MKCPYMQKALQQIVITQKPEDEGEPDKQILQETYDYQDCVKAQCGAWHRGRCRYKG